MMMAMVHIVLFFILFLMFFQSRYIFEEKIGVDYFSSSELFFYHECRMSLISECKGSVIK